MGHVDEIVELIRQLPKQSLPEDLGTSNRSNKPLGKSDRIALLRAGWLKLPWYARTSLEGLSIVFVVLLGISVGPRLRELYERDLDQTFSDFTEAFFSKKNKNDTANLPMSRGKDLSEGAEPAVDAKSQDFENSESDSESDSASGGDEGDSETTNASEDVRVGNAEIWRFNLKTDSPHEFRAKIIQILLDLKVPKNESGIGGIEAPGGIQFDLYVLQSIIPEIKNQIEAIAPPPPAGVEKTPLSETFTWYKSKSKRPIPAGKARVVIWLSQI